MDIGQKVKNIDYFDEKKNYEREGTIVAIVKENLSDGTEYINYGIYYGAGTSSASFDFKSESDLEEVDYTSFNEQLTDYELTNLRLDALFQGIFETQNKIRNLESDVQSNKESADSEFFYVRNGEYLEY